MTASDTEICAGATTSPLEAQQTTSYRVECEVPADLEEGDYWYGVILDPDHDLDELDEDNNSATDPQQVSVVAEDDTGLIFIAWDYESDASFEGTADLWVYYLKTETEICRYTWDTHSVTQLSDCEDCDFAWELEYTDGRSDDLAACQGIWSFLTEDYPLDNDRRGFATEWTNPDNGTSYADVLMQYFGSPYYAWWGVAYADYADGQLSYTTVNGYYYY